MILTRIDQQMRVDHSSDRLCYNIFREISSQDNVEFRSFADARRGDYLMPDAFGVFYRLGRTVRRAVMSVALAIVPDMEPGDLVDPGDAAL